MDVGGTDCASHIYKPFLAWNSLHSWQTILNYAGRKRVVMLLLRIAHSFVAWLLVYL